MAAVSASPRYFVLDDGEVDGKNIEFLLLRTARIFNIYVNSIILPIIACISDFTVLEARINLIPYVKLRVKEFFCIFKPFPSLSFVVTV